MSRIFQEIEEFLTKVIEINLINQIVIESPFPLETIRAVCGDMDAPGELISPASVCQSWNQWASTEHRACYPLMQTGTPCGQDNVEQILPQDLGAEDVNAVDLPLTYQNCWTTIWATT